jgi:hypothetical protein
VGSHGYSLSLFNSWNFNYYHRQAVDCLDLPFWQRWDELNIVILQYPDTERADRILRGQLCPIRECDRNRRVGILNCCYSGLEEDL